MIYLILGRLLCSYPEDYFSLLQHGESLKTRIQKIYLSPVARLEMRVMQIFLLFFRNSFFYAYRHSDLEGSCSNGTNTWHANLVVVCGP
jgi:hypothetical protein